MKTLAIIFCLLSSSLSYANYSTAVISDETIANAIYDKLFTVSGKEKKTYNDNGELVQSFVQIDNSNCIREFENEFAKTRCFLN